MILINLKGKFRFKILRLEHCAKENEYEKVL